VNRTTTPDDLDARLRHEAQRRGISIADVARHALEEQLPYPSPDGVLSFFAIGPGGPPDASTRVEDFVGPAVSRRHSAA
jgi:hypothetical protein